MFLQKLNNWKNDELTRLQWKEVRQLLLIIIFSTLLLVGFFSYLELIIEIYTAPPPRTCSTLEMCQQPRIETES